MTEILLLLILIGLNGFFAAAEIAFISLNDAKIDVQIKEGNKKAKAIKKMLENPSKFLSTIQIGITLAGFYQVLLLQKHLLVNLLQYYMDGFQCFLYKYGIVYQLSLLL